MTNCDIAQARWRNIALWRNLWTILLFIFGTSLILVAILAVFFLIRQSWLPGAVSTVGTIVSSVGVSWVVTRRADAVKEEQEVFDDAIKICGSGSTAFTKGLRPNDTATLEVNTPGNDAVQNMTAERNKLKLFGRFL